MGVMKGLDIRITDAKLAVANAMRIECINYSSMEVVGSAYISDRPDSDIDIIVLMDHPGLRIGEVGFHGWQFGGSVGEGDNDNWGSWKKYIPSIGEVNLLLCRTKEYFQSWLMAAEVCRFLHLSGITVTRDVRVSIHNIIMDDSTADYEYKL